MRALLGRPVRVKRMVAEGRSREAEDGLRGRDMGIWRLEKSSAGEGERWRSAAAAASRDLRAPDLEARVGCRRRGAAWSWRGVEAGSEASEASATQEMVEGVEWWKAEEESMVVIRRAQG